MDWAAWYDRTGKPYVKLSYEMDTDGFPSERFVDHFHNNDNEGDEKEFSKAKKRNKARIIRSVWFNKEAEPEKHYREILMLFTSWRNEETDLIGAYSTFQERYRAMSKSIDEQMKQYAVCNEDFNQIQLDMNVLEESYDSIAPCNQDIEQQDLGEGSQDLHADFNENYNLSDDIGIPSADNTEPLILNEVPDDEYRLMVQTLNKEQKEFFYHVLQVI